MYGVGGDCGCRGGFGLGGSGGFGFWMLRVRLFISAARTHVGKAASFLIGDRVDLEV